MEDQRTLRPSRWYRHSEVTLSGPSVSFNALVRFLRVSFRSAVSRLLRLISFYVKYEVCIKITIQVSILITYQYKYAILIYVPLTRRETGRHHAIGYLASSWNCVEFEQFYFHETGSAFLLRHANVLTYDV